MFPFLRELLISSLLVSKWRQTYWTRDFLILSGLAVGIFAWHWLVWGLYNFFFHLWRHLYIDKLKLPVNCFWVPCPGRRHDCWCVHVQTLLYGRTVPPVLLKSSIAVDWLLQTECVKAIRLFWEAAFSC